MSQPFSANGSRQRGFTLIEVTVSLAVTVIVLLGVLALFDFSNKLSRVQTNISDMQQSLRVAQNDAVRLIRMAGRGDLPLGNLPDGTAVRVQNNVADGTHIGPGDSPEVLPGSDVLTIRGNFSTPIYQIDRADPDSFKLSPVGAPKSGTVQISSKPTSTNVPQDLAGIKDAIKYKRHEALLLISPRTSGPWAVVELDPDNSNITADPIIVAFKISEGLHTTDYLKFSSEAPGTYPPELTSVVSVSLLEEYRFYVRREYAISSDKTSDLTPKLARARVYPGTDTPWNDDANNWHADIADNIFDLQVALGLDTTAKDPTKGACSDGTVSGDDVNCDIYESADGESDDWMYNGEKNTDTALFASSRLYYIRLSTLARTDRRDHDYQAPELTRLEDNTYTSSTFNSTTERMYRRRVLRTVIDVRNL